MRRRLIGTGFVSGAALSALLVGGTAQPVAAAPQAPAANHVTATQQHQKAGVTCKWKKVPIYKKVIYKSRDGKYGYELVVSFKKVPDCKLTRPVDTPRPKQQCKPSDPKPGDPKFYCLGG